MMVNRKKEIFQEPEEGFYDIREWKQILDHCERTAREKLNELEAEGRVQKKYYNRQGADGRRVKMPYWKMVS